jgi:hypothetical protein
LSDHLVPLPKQHPLNIQVLNVCESEDSFAQFNDKIELEEVVSEDISDQQEKIDQIEARISLQVRSPHGSLVDLQEGEYLVKQELKKSRSATRLPPSKMKFQEVSTNPPNSPKPLLSVNFNFNECPKPLFATSHMETQTLDENVELCANIQRLRTSNDLLAKELSDIKSSGLILDN